MTDEEIWNAGAILPSPLGSLPDEEIVASPSLEEIPDFWAIADDAKGAPLEEIHQRWLDACEGNPRRVGRFWHFGNGIIVLGLFLTAALGGYAWL